jgi:opacity protein-like surface antigen
MRLRLYEPRGIAMLKSLFSATVLSLTLAASAFAADLPSRKAPAYIPPPPPALWTGVYVGLNAGYGWGATNDATTVTTPLFDGVAYGANNLDPTYARGGLISGVTALANTGVANVNQSGFIGGGQIGYNYQWGPSFLLGAEADFQGAAVGGHGSYSGASHDGMSFVDPVYYPCSTPLSSGTCTLNRTAVGAGSISAGVDWIGTVRGRLGYLFTPNLLAYGTGGLAYGGVHASATHAAFVQGVLTGLNDPTNGYLPSSYNGATNLLPVPGAGSLSDTRVGWTAGGGVEWLFSPNWSVKAEALYYDLGGATLSSSPVAALSPFSVPAKVLAPVGISAGQILIANAPATRVRFDGVIVRAGVNYHFNWAAPAPVLAKY